MIDLVHLLSKVVDQKGKILIPGVNELVDPLTKDEDSLYAPIDFDPEEFREDIGAERLLHHGEDCKKKTLQHRWRYPSLSIHGAWQSLTNIQFLLQRNVHTVPYTVLDYFESLSNMSR